MARMYYSDGSYKDTNGYGRYSGRTIARKKSSGDTIKWALLALLIIAACACLVLVQHNLYLGKHANARNYNNEIVYQPDVLGPMMSTFTVEQLTAEDGLQALLNASHLAASHTYNDKGEWQVTFFEPEWPPKGPKVILSGNTDSHNVSTCEVKRLWTSTPIDFTFADEKFVHEIKLGKHTFVLTPSQAQKLIDTIRSTYTK